MTDFLASLLFIAALVFVFAHLSGWFAQLKHTQAQAASAHLAPSNTHPLFGSKDIEFKTTRRQQSGLTGVIFFLDVHGYFPPDQLDLLHHYNLYDKLLYESGSVGYFAERANAEMLKLPSFAAFATTNNIAKDAMSVVNASKVIGFNILSSLAFRLTVHDLIVGKTITSKVPQELDQAEQAILEACQQLKDHLAVCESYTNQQNVSSI